MRHFHGVAVKIQPEARVEDPSWRWHLGLDVESSALLNDLYLGNEVDPERQRHLISLFRPVSYTHLTLPTTERV